MHPSTLRLRSGQAFRTYLVVIFSVFAPVALFAQGGAITWAKSGNAYYRFDNGELGLYSLPKHTKTVIVSTKQLTPEGKTAPLNGRSYSFSADEKKILFFTNTKKVWRLQTRGDYWVFDTNTGSLTKLG